MAKIFKPKEVEYTLKQSPIPEFSWHSSQS